MFSDIGVAKLIMGWTDRTPNGCAISAEDGSLSYAELRGLAEELAGRLMQIKGCRNRPVGICLERTRAYPVAVLAAILSATPFVPLDPNYPPSRTRLMIEDSHLCCIVASATTQVYLAPILAMSESPDVTIVPAELNSDNHSATMDLPSHNLDLEDLGLTSSHLAYVIYTSGSTGTPKGVMIEHSGLLNLAVTQIEAFEISHDSVIALFSSISFDAAISEVFTALVAGACLCIIESSGAGRLTALSEAVRVRGVTHATVPPSAISGLTDISDLDGLECLILAGEPLQAHLARKWGRHRRLINAYGPTEATVCASVFHVDLDHLHSDTVPIGRPISNTRIYILDDRMEPVPTGAAGELYIGGAGVARGYLNRPDLTAERFLASPFVAGDRLYKTGDLGRYLPDGNIEFLGRNDFQVKIRGFRIELGEIEARLVERADVGQAVVLAREDAPGDKRLVAYYVAAGGHDPDVAALRAYLAERLPEYMVPAAYVRLDALPLTPNGKLDRKTLPAPDASAFSVRTYEPPLGAVEEALAAIWAEVLGLERVGRNDNFFELGGHSLLAVKAGALTTKILERSCSVADFVGLGSLSDLSVALESRPLLRSNPVSIKEDKPPNRIPLTYQQCGIWFQIHRYAFSPAYHAQAHIDLDETIDVDRLRLAVEWLTASNDILRTTFHEDTDGTPYQFVHPDGPTALNVLENRVDPFVAWSDFTETRLFTQKFDLQSLPLVRWTLLTNADNKSRLVLLEHHIVHDGWSANLLIGHLLDRYFSNSQHDLKPFTDALPYWKYALSQQQPFAKDRYAANVGFWAQKLSGAPPEAPTLNGRERVNRDNLDGAQYRTAIPRDVVKLLVSMAGSSGITSFSLLLGAYAITLRAVTSQAEVVFGSAAANRLEPALYDTIGMFVNTIISRTVISEGLSFRSISKVLSDQVSRGITHSDFPFDQLVRALGVVGGHSNPIFQTAFSFHNSHDLSGLCSNHHCRVKTATGGNGSKFELEVIAIPAFEDKVLSKIELVWNYSTSFYDRRLITEVADTYLWVLQVCLANFDQAINSLTFSSPRQWEIARTLAAGPAAAPKTLSILGRIFRVAHQTGSLIAIVDGAWALSYWELASNICRLASYLESQVPIPGAKVAVVMERSAWSVIAMLGTLQAGCIYVPIDPSLPSSLLSSLLEDCAPAIVLTMNAVGAVLPLGELAAFYHCVDIATLESGPNDGRVFGYDDCLAEHLERCAYIIYTSGSTGKPKGVEVSHANLQNLVDHQCATLEIESTSRVAQYAPFGFDAHIYEVVCPLTVGASLYLVGRDQKTRIVGLEDELREHEISHVTLPTAVTTAIGDPGPLPAMRLVTIAGEPLPSVTARQWIRRTRVLNAYGPTETTVCAGMYHVLDVAEGMITIPIGRPITNGSIYILNDRMEPVPTGAAGELYIGGAGVARGYLNRPDLTAERFLASPFVAGDRLYKTGDLGRYLPDGNIEFLGRNDFQVKIRGFRIELGEIEARLVERADVGQAVVLAREDAPGDKRLVAYYVAAGGHDPDVAALRAYLAERLPEYMVPAAYVRLDALPLTPNGKLDRKTLPAPDASAFSVRTYEPPLGAVEEALAAIWAEVLGLERVGRNDNFFELGGHSLLAAKISARSRQRFSPGISVRMILDLARIGAIVGNTNIQIK